MAVFLFLTFTKSVEKVGICLNILITSKLILSSWELNFNKINFSTSKSFINENFEAIENNMRKKINVFFSHSQCTPMKKLKLTLQKLS